MVPLRYCAAAYVPSVLRASLSWSARLATSSSRASTLVRWVAAASFAWLYCWVAVPACR